MSADLSVICWRWGTRYGVECVNRLRSMLARHLHIEHRLFCITDDPSGLDYGITAIPIWPANGLGRCRRLRIFDESMRGIFGDRMLQLDIDCVIVNDITPLVDRQDPFVIWRSVPELKYLRSKSVLKPNPENGLGAYNTSMVLMNTGILPGIWPDYLADQAGVEEAAKKAGLWTSLFRTVPGKPTTVESLKPGDDDQAVISLYARKLDPPTWLERDGIYKVGRRGFADRSKLPDNARIVFFNGSIKGNQPGEQAPEWVREHWR